jgi:hypothetical protein
MPSPQTAPQKPFYVAARIALALAIGGLVASALFVAALGVRANIASALETWRFAAKGAIVLVCLASAMWVSARLSGPDAEPRAMLLALAPLISMLASAVALELVWSPADTWASRAIGSNALLCLTSIPALSLAPFILLLVALRAGAPRSPPMAGAAAELLAGALAAALYGLHCFDDSPLFVALWYTPASPRSRSRALSPDIACSGGERVEIPGTWRQPLARPRVGASTARIGARGGGGSEAGRASVGEHKPCDSTVPPARKVPSRPSANR